MIKNEINNKFMEAELLAELATHITNDDDQDILVSKSNFIHMLILSCKQQDSIATKYLGDIYCKGLFGIQENLINAIKCYLDSASLGNLEAFKKLIYYYDNEIVVGKSEMIDVVYSLEDMIENTEPISDDIFYMLWVCYENGVGVEKKHKKAFAYLNSMSKHNKYSTILDFNL